MAKAGEGPVNVKVTVEVNVAGQPVQTVKPALKIPFRKVDLPGQVAQVRVDQCGQFICARGAFFSSSFGRWNQKHFRDFTD